jgi:2-polyprenyl-3-methyl-5-hydroxy-6-metoxy-1,4-benzoquinol methylase
MKYNEHSCRWCEEAKFEVIVKGPDLLLDLPGDFQFVECVNCGLLRQNPYPDWESLKEYYPEDYSSYLPQASEIQSHSLRLDKRYGLWKRVNLVNKYKSSGRWLDIGCGTGRVLQEALVWKKWDLMGIEPVKHAAEYTHQRTGIPIINDRLENFVGYEFFFDIITMWDVLEHLNDPIKNLEKISEILKPNGLFVFSMPNLDSWDRKLFKANWIGYDLPRHMHLFPAKLLKEILTKYDFTILKKKCVAGSHGAFMLDLEFLSRGNKSKFLEKILSKGPDFIIPRFFTLLPMWILDRLKLGSNITYVIQKNVTNK